ncbi:MAG: glycosyltransferase [Crocinitomicaceae bacterium]|nr:glycosyltransferase [Crocinitomicaceae bacterium]
MKVIVSVTNDLYTDQRVHKVCSFIQSQGHDVLLVGRLRKDSLALTRTYQTKRFQLPFDKGALFYASYSIRLFWFLLFTKFDILVSNDLDTLLPNYLAKTIKRKEIVYDSHEYFTEVPELVNRPKTQAVWERIEGWIFPKLKHVYTVNHSIASRYEKKYKVPLLVVRNISPTWNPSQLKTKKELGIPEDKFVLIFQGAGINIDRGGEEAVKSMQYLENTVLLFVGDGDVVPYLKQLSLELKLEDKVFFFGKRPYSEMMNFTKHADLGLTLDKDTNINYRFSLPNKVFDYMHANTPILASDLVEVKKIVAGYEIGKITQSHDPIHLAETILEIQNNPEQLARWKENCVKAARVENWENEVQKLAAFYPKVKS